MSNKTKTSMILSTTTIALLAVMLTPNAAFANHTPWYGGPALLNGDVQFYFHCTSLDTMSVDGDRTNNCGKVKTEAQQSMSTYTNLGNDIDFTTSTAFVDYIIYATDLGAFGPSGQATYPDQTGDYVRYNDWRDFGTTGGCNNIFGYTYAYNIEWITNHEFGHTAGLAHIADGENSVMVGNCASSWSTVQSHDDTVLDTVY